LVLRAPALRACCATTLVSNRDGDRY
jgi:hypothetical protein